MILSSPFPPPLSFSPNLLSIPPRSTDDDPVYKNIAKEYISDPSDEFQIDLFQLIFSHYMKLILCLFKKFLQSDEKYEGIK